MEAEGGVMYKRRTIMIDEGRGGCMMEVMEVMEVVEATKNKKIGFRRIWRGTSRVVRMYQVMKRRSFWELLGLLGC